MDEITSARLARHGSEWAATVRAVLRTAWPWAPAHMCLSADDCQTVPEVLHPAFHASLDWHSAAHMQWSAMLLLESSEDITAAPHSDLVEELDTRLTAQNIAVEAAYLAERRSYERPYGWGWAALLSATAARLAQGSDPLANHAETWAEALSPLSDVIADHLVAWLPNLAAPVRHGVHSNTAFALGLARDAYETLGRPEVVTAIDQAAMGWFASDMDYPSAWEPSGSDFLSPALTEADLMRRVLSAEEFGPWLRTFLPVLGEPGDPLLALPEVLDPTDGHAVHLYGLGLSRSAMLRRIAPWLEDPARARVLQSSAEQFAWASQPISEGDFMSTHWLVSFALL
ncbi:DUF2891 domain-containing protein [Aestuariimicrobium sp. p3-SID1156]|uniref:DUF2891 domain-containing protein n=1 Tax=Aestuariimicrobium sp. p3-SID1156 TaxID=2916038 RepID=UPI00223BFBC8|nr:DUF2891 domain-containing protein [Aestuariimicrobium sp. p3-SID1156]MCT1458890.1 DUF2891 domain-containing protein [Aestuariimicrobium sp. p3-SID1156]